MTAKYEFRAVGKHVTTITAAGLAQAVWNYVEANGEGNLMIIRNFNTMEKGEGLGSGPLLNAIDLWVEQESELEQTKPKKEVKQIEGTIKINVEKGTVTVELENGSYCLDHYTNGVERFLHEEIEFTQQDNFKIRQQNKPLARRQ